MRDHKKFSLTAVSVGAALALSACMQGGASQGDEVATKDFTNPTVGTVKDGSLKGTTMTYVSWGGAMQQGQEKAFAKPFAEASGAKVLSDGPTDNAKIRAQVEAGNVSWDVVDSGQRTIAASCGTLYEKLNKELLDLSKLPKSLEVTDCAVPVLAYGFTFFYNAEKYKNNPPNSWADFFDTKKFPGTRGIDGRPNPSEGTLEAALLADGVAPADLYPIDIDRALKKWSEIKDSLKFWTTGAGQTQMAQNGEADMLMAWSGRIYEADKNGAKFMPVWNQSFIAMDVLAIVKGSKNLTASHAFINYALGAEQQTKQSELSSYSPVNVDAKPKLTDEAKTFDATRPEVLDKAIATDSQYWADNQQKTTDKWSAWLNK